MASQRRNPLLLAAVTPLLAACGDCGRSASTSSALSTNFRNAAGNVSVDVSSSPFAIVVRDAQGNVLLESAAGDAPNAGFALTHDTDERLARIGQLYRKACAIANRLE